LKIEGRLRNGKLRLTGRIVKRWKNENLLHEAIRRITKIKSILSVSLCGFVDEICRGANEKAFVVPPSGGSGRLYPFSRLLKTPPESGTTNAFIESEFRSWSRSAIAIPWTAKPCCGRYLFITRLIAGIDGLRLRALKRHF
jgi:hypothetical protein